MAATATRPSRRRKAVHEEEHENHERWLVSYADMLTVLMCLFIVLFSISSVNISKFKDLQRSLQSAFSGQAVAGGRAIMHTGATARTERAQATPPLPALMPKEAIVRGTAPTGAAQRAQEAAAEQEQFRQLKRRVDAAAAELGLRHAVQTQIRERGLVVRLLTDGVFFDSGSAELKPSAVPILQRLSAVLAAEGRHPVVVEGYTDSQPITGRYPSNWELSGARASTVLRTFAAGGVNQGRMSVSGYGQRHPIATNTTAAGRSKNRRVEVVMTRMNTSSPATP
jgi:chemotaxis protein MotB